MEELQSQGPIDIIQLAKKFLRYWPWFVLSIVVCLTAGYFYLLQSPIIYETTAKIKILEEEKQIDLAPNPYKTEFVNLQNEIQVLTSYPILEKVEKELQLSHSFYEDGAYRMVELNALPFRYQPIFGVDSVAVTGSFRVNVTSNSFEVNNMETDDTTIIENHDSFLVEHGLPFEIKIESPEQLALCLGREFYIFIQSPRATVLGLRGSIEVSSINEDSEVLQLTMQGENYLKSEKILNSLIKVFNEDGVQDREMVARSTLEFIDERFASLSKELDSIELNKEDFKQRNNLVDFGSDTSLSIEQRATADDEVFRVENQLELSQLLEAAMNNPNATSKLLPSNFGLENPDINDLVKRYNEALLDSETLINNGGANNPIVKQLQSQLEDIRSNIDISIKGYKNRLLLTQKQLASRDKKFKSEFYSLPQKEKLLRAINRKQEIKESLFLLLLEKREEVSIDLAVTEPSIKVVESAITGTYPVSPNARVVYVASFLMGLFFPLGVLIIMFSLDTKIYNKKDLETLVSDIPIVGEIPQISSGNSLVFSDINDRSVLAESFRLLSSNVDYYLPLKNQGKGRVIYTSSTLKGEGKTFIALNLSLAFSSLNKKVLLIGADLRNPQLHHYLKVDKNHLGLSSYLHDTNVNWKKALVKGFKDHKNHDTLISGVVPMNPPNLLNNDRFGELLDEAKELYDYIIVDTAPTIAVTDTMLISKFADGTVHVVRANYTEKNLLEYSNNLARNKKLRNMSYVLNQVVEKDGSNYGHGYGYGEDIVERTWKDKIFNR